MGAEWTSIDAAFGDPAVMFAIWNVIFTN